MDETKASKPNKELKEMEFGFNSFEEQMSAFLYVGKEFPLYHPGNLFAHNYFLAVNVECIEKLAADENKQLLPIEIILKVMPFQDEIKLTISFTRMILFCYFIGI